MKSDMIRISRRLSGWFVLFNNQHIGFGTTKLNALNRAVINIYEKQEEFAKVLERIKQLSEDEMERIKNEDDE